MQDTRRNAFFLYYDSKTDFVWVCDVTQEYDPSLEDWRDVDDPSMSCGYGYAYADTDRAPWGEGGRLHKPVQDEPRYVYGEVLGQMALRARNGWTFLGYRQTIERLD